MGTSDSGSLPREGALWAIVRERWREALASGALQPMETVSRPLENQGIPFVVRVVYRQMDKPRRGDNARQDPFAPPYDGSLFLAEVPPHHAALLNKFPVLPEHVLLVTRDYADQEALITEADFAALAAAMAGKETLGFYNGGPEAGASQSHKHLQVVPLPLADDDSPVPLEPFLGRLPFLHAWTELKDGWPVRAARLADIYHRLWRACGYEPNGDRQPVPYNLLLTRRHVWLVPRRRRSVEGVEVNGLGYAGALLAMNPDQARLIERTGPLRILERAGFEGTGVRIDAAG